MPPNKAPVRTDISLHAGKSNANRDRGAIVPPKVWQNQPFHLFILLQRTTSSTKTSRLLRTARLALCSQPAYKPLPLPSCPTSDSSVVQTGLLEKSDQDQVQHLSVEAGGAVDWLRLLLPP